MLTKEECEKALRNICETVIDIEADGYNQPRSFSDYCFSEIDILKQLIKEHFKLKEEYERLQYHLKECHKELKKYYNPQPYKFEDLETDMLVYDKLHNDCFCVRTKIINSVSTKILGNGCHYRKYEENRFFPVWMALPTAYKSEGSSEVTREQGKIHEIKIEPQYFKKAAADLKPWELRINDRDYKVGDILFLCEWDPEKKEFTGKSLKRKVVEVFKNLPYLPEDVVIMTVL